MRGWGETREPAQRSVFQQSAVSHFKTGVLMAARLNGRTKSGAS